ncbi:MAG: FAD-dependent monooxygenase, partial [Paracoccaceae bacterium]|nr:FAD-dependent monooxygenase [Paracoccaceae bacterium]
MDSRQTDILICGGGLAGLIAAAVLGADGWQVTVVDPGPKLPGGIDQRDQRSTAFLQPAQALFTEIGLWERLHPLAVPLAQLRIVDTTGDPPTVRDERTFRADEMSDDPFGWNFLNWQMRQDLLAHLDAIDTVTLRFGTGLRSLLTRTTGAIATLSDGTQLRAKLVIGADGRNSAVRDAAGIGVKTTRYGQKALAFSVTHPVPHHNVSTEIYHQGGPFTMVPLADVDGSPASAIVWMNQGRRALELAAMDEKA